MLGEENPADLLTKHSLSRARLEKLVELHGCKYLEGRAETAPLMREGVSTRTTMADGVGGLIGAAGGVGATQAIRVGAIDGADNIGWETSPNMPHLRLSDHDLDIAYPSIVPPEEEHLEDIVKDADDGTYQAGLRMAEGIRKEMQQSGRRRGMSPIQEEKEKSKDDKAKSESKDGKARPKGATRSSALGRRRSVKDGLVPGCPANTVLYLHDYTYDSSRKTLEKPKEEAEEAPKDWRASEAPFECCAHDLCHFARAV